MAYHNRPDRNEDADSSGILFDLLKLKYNLKRDCHLAAWLGTSTGYVSKVRHGVCEVNDEVIVHVHEETGWSVKKIKEYIRTGGLREQIKEDLMQKL